MAKLAIQVAVQVAVEVAVEVIAKMITNVGTATNMEATGKTMPDSVMVIIETLGIKETKTVAIWAIMATGN